MRALDARHGLDVAQAQQAALIDERTAVLCLSHVEYGTGQLHDLARFAKQAHAHGALLVVDATQSAGQVPIDVQAAGADAVAASTYKWLCGPFGAGIMYLSPGLQGLSPGIVGWRSHENMWDFQADRLVYPRSAKRNIKVALGPELDLICAEIREAVGPSPGDGTIEDRIDVLFDGALPSGAGRTTQRTKAVFRQALGERMAESSRRPGPADRGHPGAAQPV